jgi:hypothetical protein
MYVLDNSAEDSPEHWSVLSLSITSDQRYARSLDDVDKQGQRADRQYCMIFGLCMQAIFGFALSGAYNKLVPNHIAGFAIMYGVFLAFGVSSFP